MTLAVYHSATGVTKRVAKQFSGIPLNAYTEGAYVLFVPSYGAPITGQYVPRPVKQFLREHGDQIKAVVGVGNRTFGNDFCKAAKLISERFGVPLLRCIDMVLTEEDERAINNYLGEGNGIGTYPARSIKTGERGNSGQGIKER